MTMKAFANGLFDSFLLCGAEDLDNIQEADPRRSICGPLLRFYKSNVIFKIPVNSRYVDDSIVKLCLPNDVQIFAYPEKTSYHSFVIVRDDGSKSYGGSLVFYEQVRNQNLSKTLMKLQVEYEKELSTSKNSNRVKIMGGSYNPQIDTLYVSKAICLISSFPLSFCLKGALTALYSATVNMDLLGLSLESHLYHLLNQVSIPKQPSVLRFSVCTTNLTVFIPGRQDFSMYDNSLIHLFNIVPLSTFIDLFICALLECQLVLVSDDFSKLVQVAEAILTLMYPFKWPHTYVPIVPYSLRGLLDAPVPYIMGIKKMDENMPEGDQRCVCDLDENKFNYPSNLPKFPYKDALQKELESAVFFRWNAMDSYEASCADSKAMRRINELALKVLDEPPPELERPDSVSELDLYKQIVLANTLIREIFLNLFVELFYEYERFVIRPDAVESAEEWLQAREFTQNFDRSSFLADQPKVLLPFLSAFTATQVFAFFIDQRIALQWKSSDDFKVFDSRIEAFKIQVHGMKPSFHETCENLPDVEDELLKELNVPPVNAPNSQQLPCSHEVLTGEAAFDNLRHCPVLMKPDSKIIESPEASSDEEDHQAFERQPSLPLMLSRKKSIDSKFLDSKLVCEQILKDCKIKIKRLMFSQHRSDSASFGYTDNENLANIEETTLITSLCDLLERIWAHGLHSERYKSPLWHHLTCYRLLKQYENSDISLEHTKLSHALLWCIMRKRLVARKNSKRPSQTIDPKTVPTSLLSMILKIDSLASEIQSEVGLARAFLRLCLELHVFYQCFTELFSEADLLRTLFKKEAFLRHEEEREQFLMHMRSLTILNLTCFTNAFPRLKFKYVVRINNSKQSAHNFTTARPYIAIAGTLCETATINFPNNALTFELIHYNIGHLLAIRAGHDDSGLAPKWSFESISIQDVITTRRYLFESDKPIGRSGDDPCLEKIIPARLVTTSDAEQTMNPTLQSENLVPKRLLFKRSTDISHIQGSLWNFINETCEIISEPEQRPGAYLYLIFKRNGFCDRLETVISDGIKGNMFRRKHAWDLFLEFASDSAPGDAEEKNSVDISHTSNLMNSINETERIFANHEKRERFQIWICLAWHYRTISEWIKILGFYFHFSKNVEEGSFIHEQSSVLFLSNMLSKLEKCPYTPSICYLDEIKL